MRRVVVTGLGTVCPCGNDVASTWDAVVAGRTGIDLIRSFDTEGWAVRVAGEVKGFDPADHLEGRLIKRLETFTVYAMVATREALRDAGFDVEGELGDRAGVYVGSGIGGLTEIERGAIQCDREGPRSLTPFFIPRALVNLAAGQIAMAHGARGPSLCISTACATGNHSIGEGWRAIRAGDADVVIAGGTEATVTPLGIAGFMAMKAMSRRNDDPATACRPFDAGRDGFVMGEGAGILVLEDLDHARARGVRVYAELVGYGLTNDAFHVTAPPPGHAGAVRCMRMALASAGLAPEAIDYVNAHGTSTPTNDVEETRALKTVFQEHAWSLLVSSTKSMTGHLLGAAGGLEAVLVCKAIQQGIVPPTSTLREPDPDCDLDYVPGEARRVPIRAALSNAFGFGGTNAALVFRRFEA